VIPCETLPIPDASFDSTTLSNEFPEIKNFRSLNEKNECVFKAPYHHLNDLLKFTTRRNYTVTHVPASCKMGQRPMIIFGIKSMPENKSKRNAIRKSWLDTKYWNNIGTFGGHHFDLTAWIIFLIRFFNTNFF